jgi:hypothetical protein
MCRQFNITSQYYNKKSKSPYPSGDIVQFTSRANKRRGVFFGREKKTVVMFVSQNACNGEKAQMTFNFTFCNFKKLQFFYAYSLFTAVLLPENLRAHLQLSV